MHMVALSKIIKPKEEGGLGIQAAKAKNVALLAKLNWQMYHERDSLWVTEKLLYSCSKKFQGSKQTAMFS